MRLLPAHFSQVLDDASKTYITWLGPHHTLRLNARPSTKGSIPYTSYLLLLYRLSQSLVGRLSHVFMVFFADDATRYPQKNANLHV
jgi:hypothetical protein